MQILIIKDGILRELTTEEEVGELKKDNWQYRLTSASRDYCIIDYDKDLARPYVKAILAKVNKLKEVKMLWGVLFLLIFTYISLVILWVVQYISVNDLRKTIVNQQASISTTQKKEQESILQQMRNFDRIDEVNTGAISPPVKPINNHLLR